MKLWLILRKYKYRKKFPLLGHSINLKPQAVKLVLCFASIILVLPGDVYRFNAKTFVSTPSQLLTTINHTAAKITVKVLAADALGSGIIWERQGSNYLVVTNQHVLRAGDSPYHIQTPDGQIHHARVVTNSFLNNQDLALLKFRATHNTYSIATVGKSSSLTVGESVFAAGFPAEPESLSSHLARSPDILAGFTLKTGRVAVILDEALEEGYQIGYTNDVKKGMSGGPLLNSKGEVVGINGKHAYPLWDAPDLYEDGSQPCPPLQELITRSSLAIPVEKVLQFISKSNLFPKNKRDRLFSNQSQQPIIVNFKEGSNTSELILRMQTEAELSKNCQESSQDSDSLEVNK